MSIDACARLVAKGDPDRFAATMATALPARAPLLVLYAFNIEVARAPWASQESLISHMRLQWWRDIVDQAGRSARPAHEVAGPLVDLILAQGLDRTLLVAMITARQFDIDRQAFEGFDALCSYLGASAGNLMQLAGQALGSKSSNSSVFQAGGIALGALNLLRAAPRLTDVAAAPFDVADHGLITRIAQFGLIQLETARQGQGTCTQNERAAFLPLWQVQPLLQKAARLPALIGLDQLVQHPLGRSFGLVKAGILGLW